MPIPIRREGVVLDPARINLAEFDELQKRQQARLRVLTEKRRIEAGRSSPLPSRVVPDAPRSNPLTSLTSFFSNAASTFKANLNIGVATGGPGGITSKADLLKPFGDAVDKFDRLFSAGSEIGTAFLATQRANFAEAAQPFLGVTEQDVQAGIFAPPPTPRELKLPSGVVIASGGDQRTAESFPYNIMNWVARRTLSTEIGPQSQRTLKVLENTFLNAGTADKLVSELFEIHKTRPFAEQALASLIDPTLLIGVGEVRAILKAPGLFSRALKNSIKANAAKKNLSALEYIEQTWGSVPQTGKVVKTPPTIDELRKVGIASTPADSPFLKPDGTPRDIAGQKRNTEIALDSEREFAKQLQKVIRVIKEEIADPDSTGRLDQALNVVENIADIDEPLEIVLRQVEEAATSTESGIIRRQERIPKLEAEALEAEEFFIQTGIEQTGPLTLPGGRAEINKISKAMGKELIDSSSVPQNDRTMQAITTLTARLKQASTTPNLPPIQKRRLVEDVALLEIMMATGARANEVVRFTKQQLRRVANEGIAPFESVKKVEVGGEDVARSRLTDLIPGRREQAMTAAQDLLSLLDDVADDGLVFMKGGKSTKPAVMNERLRALRASNPDLTDLPKEAREFRRLVATDIVLKTDDLGEAARQLGDESIDLVVSSYITETAIDLSDLRFADEVLDELGSVVGVENVGQLQKLIGKALAARRRKSGVAFGEEIETLTRKIGEDAVTAIKLTDDEVRSLARFTGIERDLQERGLRLLKLRDTITSLGNVRNKLQKRKALFNKFGKEHPTAKQTRNSINDKIKFSTDASRELNSFLQGEFSRYFAEVRAAGLESTDSFQTLFNRIMPNLDVALAEARAQGFAIAGRAFSQKAARFITERKDFAGISLKDNATKFKAATQEWLNDRIVADILEEKGMSRDLTTTTGIKQVLVKAVKFSNRIFGGDDTFGPISKSKKLTVAQNEKLDEIALAIADGKMLSDFTVARKSRKAIPPSGTIDDVDVGETLVPRKIPESIEEQLYPDSNADSVVPNPPKLENIIEGVKTNPKLKASIERLGTGEFTPGGLIAASLSLIGNGRALLTDGIGRLILGHTQSMKIARGFASIMQDTLRTKFKVEGVELIQKRTTSGGSSTFFSEDLFSLVEARTVRVNNIERQVGGWRTSYTDEILSISDDELRESMYAWDRLYEIHPDNWPLYYNMSDEVRSTLLYPLQVRDMIEKKLFPIMRSLGIDIDDQLRFIRVENYMPRLGKDRQYFSKSRGRLVTVPFTKLKEAGKLIAGEYPTAKPVQLNPRSIKSYEQALFNGVFYGDGPDALGFYLQTTYEMIAEAQIKAAIKPFITESLQATTNRAAALTALVRYNKNLISGKVPDVKQATKWRKKIESQPDILRMLDEAIDNPNSPEVNDFIKAEQKAASNLKDEQDVWKKQATARLKPTFLQNHVFSPEQVKEYARLTDPSSPWLAIMKTPSSALRFLKTGLDLGGLVAQGAPMLVEHPDIWARSAKQYMSVFWNPEVQIAYRAQNRAAIQEMIQNGVELGRAEPFEFLDIAAQLGTLPKAGKIPGGRALETATFGGDQIFSPNVIRALENSPATLLQGGVNRIDAFEKSFSGVLEFMRIEMWKAHRETSADLFDLAATVNKHTGVLNPAFAGTTNFQRDIQTMFFLFAPMFRRATYSMVTDALRGIYSYIPGAPLKKSIGVTGKTRSQALRQATALLTAGLAFTSIGAAMGNKDAFNPDSPRMATLPLKGPIIGDFNLGFPTPLYSLTRLVAALTMASISDKSLRGPGETGEIGFGINYDDYLVRNFRSSTSPVTGIVFDVLEGFDFVGNSMQDEGESGLKRVWNSFRSESVPFWGESASALAHSEGSIGQLVFDFFGFRNFPNRPFQQRQEMRDMIIATDDSPEFEAFRKEWEARVENKDKNFTWQAVSANREMRAFLENKYEMQGVNAKVDGLNLTEGRPMQRLRGAHSLRISKINTETRGWYNEADRAFEQGKPYFDLIDNARNRRSARFDDVSRKFDTDPNTGTVVKSEFYALLTDFEERAAELNTADDEMLRIATDKYYTVVIENPILYDEEGSFRPEEREKLIAKFKDSVPYGKYLKQIEDNLAFTTNQLTEAAPNMREFFASRKLLEEYDSLYRTAFTKEQSVVLRRVMDIRTSRDRSAFFKGSFEGRMAQGLWKQLEDKKKVWRQRKENKEGEWALVKFYGRTPVTFASNRRDIAWRKELQAIQDDGRFSAPLPTEEQLRLMGRGGEEELDLTNR